MTPITINVGTPQSPRYVGAVRVLDEIGTDEVLHLETPVRLSRFDALADAIAACDQRRPDPVSSVGRPPIGTA